MKQLHEIGLKYGTDKASFHNYLHDYERVLNPLRELPINMLEVGIANNASLSMWKEYFPNAQVFGADIDNKSYYDTYRIKTFITNQENRQELSTLPINLDFIIDDGGHTMLQQQVTFAVLFINHLKSGGIFMIEDLHTSNPYLYPGYGATAVNNTLELLLDLRDKQFPDNYQYHISNEEFSELINQISDIEIIRKSEHSITSVIRKK